MLCPDWDVLCSGGWCCAISCTRRGPWGHSVLPQAPRAHGGAAIDPHRLLGLCLCRDGRKPIVRMQPRGPAALLCSQTPPSPAPCPEVPAQLWGPNLGEPPMCANIITWSQRDEVGHWGHPFGYLRTCFPAFLLLPRPLHCS